MRKEMELVDSDNKKVGKLFAGFREVADPDFMPTFKVKRWEEHEYLRQRIPSWCDRVLVAEHNKLDENTPTVVDTKEYKCVSGVISADHKPVYTMVRLPVHWQY
eukprot:gene16622-13667_t